MTTRRALVASAALGPALAMPFAAPSRAAQADTAAMTTHPVVGTWEFTGEVNGATFPILGTFHDDGTYQEVYPWGSLMVGVWKPTGERTAEGLIVIYEYIDDRLLRGEGRWRVEVDETGNAMSSDGPFVARYVDDGSVDMAVEGPSTGIRLEVLPVLPLSELAPGGAQVLPPEWTGEATPAP